MRDVAFLVKLPEGATGIQRSRHLLEGVEKLYFDTVKCALSSPVFPFAGS